MELLAPLGYTRLQSPLSSQRIEMMLLAWWIVKWIAPTLVRPGSSCLQLGFAAHSFMGSAQSLLCAAGDKPNIANAVKTKVVLATMRFISKSPNRFVLNRTIPSPVGSGYRWEDLTYAPSVHRQSSVNAARAPVNTTAFVMKISCLLTARSSGTGFHNNVITCGHDLW
jgi:hypothetical protein